MPTESADRGWLLAAVVIAGLVMLPIAAVVTSLIRGPSPALAHLAATTLPAIVLNSLGLVLLVGIGTAVIGTTAAWLVTIYSFPGQRALTWLLLLPMAMPGYIIGYAYAELLAFSGPLQGGLRAAFGWHKGDYWFPDISSLPGLALLLVLVLYPYVYLLARAAFLEQSVCALDVARTLGHGPASRLRRVALPLARPAIAAGVALALMEALADFGTAQYLGVQTFTTAIYRTWFGMGDQAGAAQLATGLLALVAVLLWIERRARREGRFHRTTQHAYPLTPVPLAGPGAWLATLACTLPVLFGFVLPVLMLSHMHLEEGDPMLGTRFTALAMNSFLLAAIAAGLVTAVGLVVAYARRLSSDWRVAATMAVATTGYAVPGTVIAVGVLVPLGALDLAIDGLLRSLTGMSSGLMLSGSIAAVLFAYLVRFLALATGAIESGFAKIPPSMDHVARSLGCTAREVVRRVHVPLLRRSMLTAAVLVFVDVLKELPATLIVRPFNFDTLAVRVYQLASDERLGQASTGALVIVAIGLVPVLILTKLIGTGSNGDSSNVRRRR